ncbi:MAG: hypothetical protein EXQ70_07040 [Solirubrobacterales bacterium]|nr:hypothetical protein [Solirubrobacterales bacterium]
MIPANVGTPASQPRLGRRARDQPLVGARRSRAGAGRRPTASKAQLRKALRQAKRAHTQAQQALKLAKQAVAAAGGQITSGRLADGAVALGAGSVGTAKVGVVPAARLTFNSTQTIPDNDTTFTTVNGNEETFDTQGLHSGLVADAPAGRRGPVECLRDGLGRSPDRRALSRARTRAS